MNNTVPLTGRVAPELRAKLIALAKKERRTLSQYVAIRLEEMVEQLEQGK